MPTSSAAPGCLVALRTVSSTPITASSGSPNAFIVDGSTLPTQGAANPALTVMAMAARAADRIRALGRTGATDPPAGVR